MRARSKLYEDTKHEPELHQMKVAFSYSRSSQSPSLQKMLVSISSVKFFFEIILVFPYDESLFVSLESNFRGREIILAEPS